MSQNWEEIKNITVEEFTTPCPKVVSPSARITDLEKILRQEDIRHIPVQEKGQGGGHHQPKRYFIF